MRKIVLILFFVFILAPSAGAWTKKSQVKKGNALYQKGNYDASLTQYEQALKKDPESPIINFNLGTALYKNHRYDEAVSYLQKGLLGNDPLLKENSHYNLGNALYGQGEVTKEKNLDEAIAAMEEALRQFEAAWKLDDKDQEARYNHSIVEKELEKLKKKKEQQRQDQQGKQENKEQSPQHQEQQQEKNSTQSAEDKKASGQSKEQQDKTASEAQEKDPQNSASSENQNTQDQGDKKDAARAALKPGEMTKDEAKTLLRQFEQNEEPRGLLNFDRQKSSERPVLKDW